MDSHTLLKRLRKTVRGLGLLLLANIVLGVASFGAFCIYVGVDVFFGTGGKRGRLALLP